jgi:hypothetical protein
MVYRDQLAQMEWQLCPLELNLSMQSIGQIFLLVFGSLVFFLDVHLIFSLLSLSKATLQPFAKPLIILNALNFFVLSIAGKNRLRQPSKLKEKHLKKRPIVT